jgi:hypothetical protein
MKRVTLVLFIFFVIQLGCYAQAIKNYEVYFGILTSKKTNKDKLVIRKYNKENQTFFLCVDPKTLKTSIEKDSAIQFRKFDLKDLKKEYKTSPYVNILNAAASNDASLQNAGIDHAIPHERGINLTIDLCPSTKPLDKVIFTSIIEEFNKVERPAPVALSVSGLWIKDHSQDLEWLKEQEKNGNLKIDWINHSYHHRVSNKLPLKENFLLEKGTDMNYEILQNEITMLDNHIIPSVFFRFPGLVSDKSVFEKVVSYGLIPIGSDSWLAKNQKPKEGSIVLIHGNGNEPIGVKDFIKLIASERENVKNKNWLLYDLTDSLSEEEK